MASLIVGNDGQTGSREGNRNGYRGMAPGARLISLKVADAHGYTDVSQMLAAIDWVVQHRNSDGLHNIWQMGDPTAMAALSLLVVAGFALLLTVGSVRVFTRTALR